MNRINFSSIIQGGMTAAAVLQPAYVRDARRRRTGLLLCAVIVCLAVAQGAHAWDPPHYNGPVGSDDCLRCHMLHGAPGGSMTSVAGNNNLCETCHIAGGSASSLPFADADQACPRVGIASGQTASGNSHRWDSGPTGHAEAVGTITSTGTLDTGGAFTGQYAKTYTITITTGGNVGVAAFSWADGRGGSGTGLLTGTNVALNEGITLTFTDGTPAPSFALNDKWRISVRTDIAAPTNGTLTTHLEKGLIMCSTCHDQHEQAVAPFDPAAPAYGGAGTGDGRHYLRTANDIDQMCLDCHRARNVASASDGSHPVGVTIPGSGAYKTPASLPLAPGGKVQCMTCHQPHFADSTDGSLTRNKNDVNLCTDCHTNCDTVSGAHLNAASGGVWPGDAANPQTYPAVDSAKRGQCTNCHAPHGWPDPTAAPAADYPKLLVARTDHKSDGTDPDTAEDLCFGCHNSTALPNRDLKTDFSKTYHHPVKDSEQSSGRSVECSDCHTDSHKVQAGSHDYAATATSARNTVANVEKGVSGLAVNYGSGITYTTGTAAITNGSAAVTGTGTTWTSTMIGARIRFAADLSDYTIVSVPSATSLTLGTAYAGATAATASHTITYAAYTVGTAAFTLNSTSVTGTGTAWTSDLAGKKIRRTSDMVDYTIASVGSPTSLTLTAAYAGTTTGTPQPYIISLGNFVAPTNAQCTVVPASTGVVYQYEVCFKCHSNYAFPTASTTGTADFTTGGTAVNGTGTSWTPDLTGAMLLRSGDTTAYTIAAVSSATSITLASAYAGITGTGASYTVTLPPRNLTPVLTGTNNATFVNGSTTVTVPANVFITTYSTGTAAATNGSGVLTGTGTSWSSSYVGATFKFTGDSTVYKITARTSSTSITISPVYGGTTGTGKAYTIFVGAGKTGTWLKPGTDNAYYKITGVVDATHLTITPAYSGSLGANVSWQMYAAGNDIAMEFSPNNKSGHPIVTGLDNYPNSIAVGTPAKKGLQPAAMLAPWNASYTTGTAALTAGSATATGTGTTWTASLVGYSFQLNSSTNLYQIVGFTDATHITITPVPAATAAATAYTITQVGQQTMACTDCHNTDSLTPAAQGPHGSAQQFMLRAWGNGAANGLGTALFTNGSATVTGTGTTWLAANVGSKISLPGSSKIYTIATRASNTSITISPVYGEATTASVAYAMWNSPANWPNVTLTNYQSSWCANCHQKGTHQGHAKSDHSSSACYRCHIVIPHGGKVSRLINDADGTMPSRYAYNNDMSNPYFVNFTKAASGSYGENTNCRTTSGCSHHTGGPTTGENW